MAEKMISLGKKNTEASRRQALKFFFVGVMSIPAAMKDIS